MGVFIVPNALSYANAIDNLYNNHKQVDLEIWVGKNPSLHNEIYYNYWTSNIVKNDAEFNARLLDVPEFVKQTRLYCTKNNAKHSLHNRSTIDLVKENLKSRFTKLEQNEKKDIIRKWSVFAQE